MAMEIRFERLISRSVAVALSKELDMAGVKMSVERVVRLAIVGSLSIFVVLAFVLYAVEKLSALVSFVGGLGCGALFIAAIYMVLEFKIDQRKTKLEQMLPDYLQIASANLRSGISLDRAMLLAARPEFGFLSEDIKDMNMKIFGGENFNEALKGLAERYRSYQLTHSVRMIIESIIYGGAMSDLLEQLSKDMRSQQLTQKEISGQLFLYSIFIAFAGLIASPVLYGLTSQMIVVTDTVWKGILAASPGGLPTTGLSFLKPSPPKITPAQYQIFSIGAIVIITSFASLIMAAISSGSAIKGIKYLPIFVILGLEIYIVVKAVIAGVFKTIGGGV